MQRVKRFKSFRQKEKDDAYLAKNGGSFVSEWDWELKEWVRKWKPTPKAFTPTTPTTPVIKKESDYSVDREYLLELFPRLIVANLKNYACCNVDQNVGKRYNLTRGKDYEVLSRGNGRPIVIIDDKGEKKGFIDYWFRQTYKKYDFEVYAKATRPFLGITQGKLYRLLGETSTRYEIVDDRRQRQSHSKDIFGFPQKK